MVVIEAIVDLLKLSWLYTFEPPWRRRVLYSEQMHWFIWTVSWVASIAGLALGAFVAPTLVQFVGLTNSPYQDAIVIGVSLLSGFLVQVLTIFLYFPTGLLILLVVSLPLALLVLLFPPLKKVQSLRAAMYASFAVALAVSIAGVGYALYRYFSWIGPGQEQVTIAFVGALFVKVALIPFAKWLVGVLIVNRLVKWFIAWLRGNNPPAAKPS